MKTTWNMPLYFVVLCYVEWGNDRPMRVEAGPFIELYEAMKKAQTMNESMPCTKYERRVAKTELPCTLC